MQDEKYADVILPLAVRGLYTYRVPGEMHGMLSAGMAVIVPFGRNKKYTGIIKNLHNNRPSVGRLKDIGQIKGKSTLITENQLDLWHWLGSYYHCSQGEIMNAAIPSALLATGGAHAYRQKTSTYISLVNDPGEKAMNKLIDGLAKTPARQKILMTFLEMTGYGSGDCTMEVPRSSLLEESGASAPALLKMIEAGIFRANEKQVSRFDSSQYETGSLKKLSVAQKEAFDQIKTGFSKRKAVLLHGVTSSGKTEIYIHLMREAVAEGKKVLYLLPEIALTTQIINRLRHYFGNSVGVYHSGLNNNEKAEVYNRISGRSSLREYSILLGVRSSVFLPVNDLGLIIIDEEHDSSYKQFDPSPRYNARDTAIMRAHMVKARVLMGSATPSVESMYNAKSGKYEYVYLGSRFGDINMPEIILSDFKEAYRKKAMISHFTPVLIDAIDKALANGEQVVLFRNRRGFSHYIICADCGWTPVCPNCSVNYTYHKNPDRLHCHYCGSRAYMPVRCESCSSTNIRLKGFGTEKVEDEISILFPDAKVERMDYDTTRKRGSVEGLIKNLETGKTDILIGTQMISKGLDIENLTVVGILNIDGMLFSSDFRAYERCFQLASQVSGRAGRRNTRGKVIIQTADPQHPVMKQILDNDYFSMYNNQVEERKEFNYPPFSRLVRIYLKHRELGVVNEAAEILGKNLRLTFNMNVLGPEFPPRSRLQNLYIKSILLKTSRHMSSAYLGEVLSRNFDAVRARKEYSALRIYSDVDPQ
ncbi:MAG: primosomal protein N' [Bacteroidales bacterium]|nr:primosomal protein N' [Bacteroidales bacterium]